MSQAPQRYITRSYAKINLGLFLVGRYPNGYHQIETGFVFIDLSDRLEIQRAGKTTIECNRDDIPTGKDNLIVKAIHAFNRAFGVEGYFHIKLTKNIPAGAGLGGGSANAASMLHALNKISGIDAETDKLAEIGAALGADVPFFVHGKPAIGSGSGTELSPLPIQPDMWIVTVTPDIHSSTAQAYQMSEMKETSESDLKSVLLDTDMDEWAWLLRNDLEPAVIGMYPDIGNLKDQHYDMGALYAAMSGSGSSVFGLYEQEFVALEAYKYLTDLGYKTNLTRPGFKPDIGVYLMG